MKKISKKLKENFKENKYIYLTFGLAIILFIIIFILKSIIPLGKNTLLTIDFYHQYGPLLAELYDKIKAGSDLTFSFNTGLGLPFFRNFYNYLSSPFNIIMLFFKRDNIVTAFSIIIALKVIVASSVMSYFLKKFFNKNNLFITIFGLTYGFSSYFVAFYWNIMWLDSLIFLPLVILGIKKLIDEDKINLYILSLFLSIIANYFISYMICIFSCIFFLIYIIFKDDISRKDLIKKILWFILSSLIAGGLAGFMLLPFVSSLSSISATGDTFALDKTFNFNIIYFLANHFSLVDSIVFASQDYYIPNISSGILIFLLVIAFYFNSGIKLKHKIMATIVLLFLIGSFIYVPADFIWHGFHTPNDLPFRYSFIYVFVINIIAFYSVSKIDKLKIRYSIVIFILINVFLIYLNHVKFLTKFGFDFNMLLLITSLLMFIHYKLKNNDTYKYIMLFIVCIDIIFNINENWDINHNNENFMNNYKTFNSIVQNIKNKDNSFYRIEKNFNYTLNDGAWYNYNGLSAFSSVTYENMAKAQKKLGIAGNDVNSYYYNQNTPIYNSIMSIKYFIGLNNQNSKYRFLNNIENYDIYKNKYYLPIAFGVSKNIKNWTNDDYNPFLNQQDFVKNSTDVNDIFDNLTITNLNEEADYGFYVDTLINNNFENPETAKLSIKTNRTGNVYLYIYGYGLETYIVNNQTFNITPTEPYIIDIGYFEENEDINLKIFLNNNIHSINVWAYQMDDEKFANFYQNLNYNSIQITNFSNKQIEGIMEVDDDKTVFTSLNYDEGFKVFVDDKKVKTFSIANSFLGFDISKGKHNVKIIYEIPHLKLGLIMTSISLLLFVAINIIKKKNKSA